MKNILEDPLFLALFNSPVPRIIVKADAPFFTILISNDAHKLATNLVGKEISGKSVWEIFDPEEAGGNGGELLKEALCEAQNTNKTVLMPPFRYDMSAGEGAGMQEKWWQLEIMPIGGDVVKPELLLVTTNDISEQVLRERAIEEGRLNLKKLNAELEEKIQRRTLALAASELKFRSLVEQAPVAIALLTGPEQTVEAVNSEMLRIWGKHPDVISKPIIEALPEMKGQPYPEILKEVFHGGISHYENEALVQLHRNGRLEKGYFNFINYPLKGDNGNTESIIVVAHEVTEQVLNRQKIEKSEWKLQTLVMNAHYPLMILTGTDWVIEIANQQLADLWDTSLSSVIGRKLMDILPEIRDQPYYELLKGVFETGRAHGQEEEVFYLNTESGVKVKYVSFFYDPLKDESGNVTGIIVSANDITHQVNARKELERLYEQVRLSKLAAQLGTFDMDLLKGSMEWDSRCRELFGISHQEDVSYEKDFLPGLHPEDRDRVDALISRLFDEKSSNGDYDVEYRTIGAEDGKIRWVRAKGKVFFDHDDRPVRFIGSVLDITDQKENEQRRNDFIGMVSHELKTPLTSIKSYVQLALDRARKSNEAFFTQMLSKADSQTNKMINLIHGFLNVSRFENGHFKINRKWFPAKSLIQEVTDDMQQLYSSHQFEIEDSGSIEIFADRDRIAEVLSNLLNNAVKYSPSQSKITIACTEKGDWVSFAVRDEGKGIKPEEIEKIFERFYRSDESKQSTTSGFGIGLYLSSEIVKLHKGKIGVRNEQPGATFYFSLPKYNDG